MVDQDGDGSAEFGYLGELSGLQPCRVSGISQSTTPYIAEAMGRKDRGGRVRRHGYYLRVFLPSGRGRALGETQAAAYDSSATWPPDDPITADAQEARWACYAWPVERGHTGRRAFVVTQGADVFATDGTSVAYTGTQRMPTPGAAFARSGRAPADLDATLGTDASDGNRWVVVPGVQPTATARHH